MGAPSPSEEPELSLSSIFEDPSYGQAFHAHRGIPAPAMQFWCGKVSWVLAHLQSPNPRLADLGCGWGRFALPFAEVLKSRRGTIVAIDRSAMMLRELQLHLDHTVDNLLIVNADVSKWSSEIPIDVFFASEIFHSGTSVVEVLNTAARNSAVDSAFLIRSPSHKQLAGICWLHFFDTALERDLARTMDIEEICEHLKNAGFKANIGVDEIYEQRDISCEEFLRAMEGKAYSLLRVLPTEAYMDGMTRVRRYCAQHEKINMNFGTTCISAWRRNHE